MIDDGERYPICPDCLTVSSGCEDEDMTAEREAEVIAAVEAMGPYFVPAYDSETGEGIDEFSLGPCACCGSVLGGSRHDYALLIEDRPE